MKHSLGTASAKSACEILTSKLTLIEELIELGVVGRQHCKNMKMPMLVEHHDKRQDKLFTAKNEAAARLRHLNVD